MKSIFFIIFLINFSCQSQTIVKHSYGVFNSTTLNDSLYIIGGQPVNGPSSLNQLRHGFFPLTYQFLTVPPIEKVKFTVYPNPFSNLIVINIENSESSSYYYEVYNVSGQLILEETLTASQSLINTESFNAGIYFLHLRNGKNKLSVVKLIKY